MKQIFQSFRGSVWQHRDARLVLPARGISYAGDAVALVALTLRVKGEGGPPAVTALLLAFAVPTVLMIPVAGRIVDRYDSRKVLFLASLLQAAAGVGVALSDGLAGTLAFVCVLQVGQAVANPAWGALIPRIVGDELVGRATGMSQAISGAAMLVGAALGGVLVSWLGTSGALLVDSATFLVLAVVAAAVRTRRRPEPGAGRESGSLMAGLRFLFGDPLLRTMVVALWVFIVVGEAVNVVEVFLITDELGLGPKGYGLVLAVQGGGAIVGAWSSGRLVADVARSRAFVGSTALVGIACVVMGVAPGVVVLTLGALAVGFGIGMLNAVTSTLMVTRSPEELRGRVIAALVGTGRACSLIALPLGGALGELVGVRSTFAVAGGTCVVVALVAGVLVARLWSKDSAGERVSH